MLKSLHRFLIVQVGAGLTLAAASFTPVLAEDADVIATVNGSEITEGDMAIAENEFGPQFGNLQGDQRRAALLSALIEVRLLASEAEKQELADSEEFARRMEFLRQSALHSAYIEKTVTSKVTDEEVRAVYDEQVAETPPAEEVHARHILVKTKEEADEIVKQLDDGGDFEALAKEKSTDGAAAQGGDLGYFSSGQMVPEFEKVAFELQPGEYTKQPVETQFGFHVIKVEDKRQKQPPAFDAVQDRLRSALVRNKYVEQVNTLREAAEVDVQDAALKEIIDKFEQQRQGAAPETPAGVEETPAQEEKPAE